MPYNYTIFSHIYLSKYLDEERKKIDEITYLKNTLFSLNVELSYQIENHSPQSLKRFSLSLIDELFFFKSITQRKLKIFGPDTLKGYQDVLNEYCEQKIAFEDENGNIVKFANCKFVKKEFIILIVYE